MNYSDPKLQSMLAAEYVLGSLQGHARRRFEKLLFTEPGIRDAVEYWQNRLNPLAETLVPIQPSERVWKNIQNRIHKPVEKPAGWVERLLGNLDFWRGFGLAGLVMGFGFYMLSIQQQAAGTATQSYEYVAVLSDQEAKPSLVASMVSMADGGQLLKIDMLGPDATGAEHVMQVWCVPKYGGEPMSIGLLTADQKHIPLSVDQIRGLHDAAEITITFEPISQSPMPEPSGQVMYRGTMI